eukprot:6093664-Heterocapsa_arctica.AAC.1
MAACPYAQRVCAPSGIVAPLSKQPCRRAISANSRLLPDLDAENHGSLKNNNGESLVGNK